MKSILKYPGAKHRIAGWICSHMPEHKVYVEPYAGSLAVFFAKNPSKIETLNDMDGNVVNYFRVVREKPDELARALRLTPFARDEYMAAFESNTLDTDVEKARKFAVKCWQGFGCSNVYRNGFRSSQQGNSPRTTKDWNGLPDRLLQASRRLMNAQIENLPADEIIQRYNTSDVFLYLDPPYVPETRKKYLYLHEMEAEDHIRLLASVRNHPGKVMISGYDNALYNDMLRGWRKDEICTQAEGGLKRKETIWMNYPSQGHQMTFAEVQGEAI